MNQRCVLGWAPPEDTPLTGPGDGRKDHEGIASSAARIAAAHHAARQSAVVRIDDGGITGPGFFEQVRKLRGPVLNSPKGQHTALPPDLVPRPVVQPAPYWTWSLVTRRDDTRPAVRAVAEALTNDVGTLGLDADGAWLPVTDPHRVIRVEG